MLTDRLLATASTSLPLQPREREREREIKESASEQKFMRQFSCVQVYYRVDFFVRLCVIGRERERQTDSVCKYVCESERERNLDTQSLQKVKLFSSTLVGRQVGMDGATGKQQKSSPGKNLVMKPLLLRPLMREARSVKGWGGWVQLLLCWFDSRMFLQPLCFFSPIYKQPFQTESC